MTPHGGLRQSIIMSPLWHGLVAVMVVVSTVAVGWGERNLPPAVAVLVALFVVWHVVLLIWFQPSLPVTLTYWFGTTLLVALLVHHSDTFAVLLYGLYSVAFMTLRWWGLLQIVVLSLVAALSAGTTPAPPQLVLASIAPVVISLVMTLVMEMILRQVEKRDAALAELARAQEAVAQAAQYNGVLEERQRLAREIHDTLAQSLIGILGHVDAADELVDPGDLRTRASLVAAAAAGRTGLAELRRSVRALRSVALDHAGLPQALREVAEKWANGHRTPVELRVTGQQVAITPAAEATVLRAAQEALTNVAKHARAQRVAMTLSYMGDAVTLDVTDDGVGFEASTSAGGYGLTGMRERTEAVGGELCVESSPEGGTTVAVSVPAA